ncbi:MAG: hypothetical protein OHK0038_15800 [Flammeovirgaceae bacterium]
MSETENHYKPQWLTNIQENSWEPELLISGGAIFTLIQIPPFLYKNGILLEQQNGFWESITISNLIALAVNALTIGFVIHIILRGFWTGMICLSFTFPKGINREKMDYAEIFKNRLSQLDNVEDFVINLEKICCLVFALSFITFLSALAFFLTGFLLIPHTGLKEQVGELAFQVLRLGSFVALGAGFIYMIDFLTLGGVKKIKAISKIYFPIYTIFSYITLSFLYREAYYAFITNIKWWKALLVFIVWGSVAFAITRITHPRSHLLQNEQDPRTYIQFESQELRYSTEFYDDARDEDELIERASIPSEIVQGNFVKLFLVHHKVMEVAMNLHCGIEAQQKISDEQRLDCLNNFYEVKIDQQPIKNIRWRYYKHPKTNESGILGVLSLENFENGEHIITVTTNIPEKTSNRKRLIDIGIIDNHYAVIPFWKDAVEIKVEETKKAEKDSIF